MPARALVLIGAGRMGQALASGWLAGDAPPDLTIVDPDPSAAVEAWAKAGRLRLNPAPAPAPIVVLAVKPQVFSEIADRLAPWVGKTTLVISIMAGHRIRQIAGAVGTDRVIRAMPNTPGAVGAGVTVLSVPDAVMKKDVAAARALLKPLGDVEGPVAEDLMSAVVSLSGSGPAYVFLLAEVMAEAGVALGLDPVFAARLARRTIQGAAALMGDGSEAPSTLRRGVTSPSGTTAAALDILMDEPGMPSLVTRAMKAAAARERDLGRARD